MSSRPRLPFVLVALSLLVFPLVTLRADVTSAEVYMNAATQLVREWRFRDALRLFERAERAAATGHQRLRAALGVTTSAVRIAEFDIAFATASNLVATNPDDPEVLDAYGQAAWANGLFQEAENAFRQVLARNRFDATALLGIARITAARNRLDEALDQARAAMVAAPSEPDVYSVIANIARRMRRLDEAVSALNRYYTLLPPIERDKRTWTQGEITFLRSFGRRVPGEIAAASLTGVHTVPFRLVKDKVIVEAVVNGQTIDLIIDTGAEQTVISEGGARRLGLAPISTTISAGIGEIGLRDLRTAQIDRFELGSLKIRNVPCLIKTPALTGLPIGERENFSPLALGLSMVIDYQRRQLTLARSLDVATHALELPLWFSRLATVRGTVNGSHAASFIVDTGGEVISIGLDTARALTPQPQGRRIPLQVFGSSGWDRDAFLMPGVSLAFDELALKASSIVVMNLRAPSVLLGYRVGGTIGHRLLSNYRVTFDLQRSVQGLDPM